MLEQAVSLAGAGAIWPVAFAAVVGLLSGTQPMRRSVAFIAGGALISLTGFIAVILVIRDFSLTPRIHPNLSGTIQIVAGALLLLLAARTVWQRRHQQPTDDTEDHTVADPNHIHGLDRDPGPDRDVEPDRRAWWPAFLSGIVVFFPGAFLIAAARSIADARASALWTYTVVVICTVVLLAFAELPTLAYAIAPNRVGPLFSNTIAWTRRHSYQLIIAVELIGGVYLLSAGLDTISSHM